MNKLSTGVLTRETKLAARVWIRGLFPQSYLDPRVETKDSSRLTLWAEWAVVTDIQRSVSEVTESVSTGTLN